jgi:hypothetical protein
MLLIAEWSIRNVNDDLFDCVLGEMMYCIGALVLGILKQYVDNDLDIWFGSDIEEFDLGALNVGFGDIGAEVFGVRGVCNNNPATV